MVKIIFDRCNIVESRTYEKDGKVTAYVTVKTIKEGTFNFSGANNICVDEKFMLIPAKVEIEVEGKIYTNKDSGRSQQTLLAKNISIEPLLK